MTRPIRAGERPASDDSGASLVLALVIVMVFSIIIAAVLTFADTSLRTTMVLRDQAGEGASADGAAEIAVNALRDGDYDGTGPCFGGSANELTLKDFYQPPTGPATSAVVTCAPDTAHSGPTDASLPPATVPEQALLTLATGTETGLHVDAGVGRDVGIRGDVFSRSSVNVARGSLTSTASLRAVGACTGTVRSTPAPQCPFGSAGPTDPDHVPPSPGTGHGAPVCPSAAPFRVLQFTPGVYTDVEALDEGTRVRCTTPILYFPAGTYYFNFNANRVWQISNAYVIGGTNATGTAPPAGAAPKLPGWCQSPVPPSPASSTWVPPDPNKGVRFVFAGDSRISFQNTQVELCGNYSTTAPPVVLYGLKTAVGGIPAQTGCVTEVPYPTNGCAVISTDDQPKSQMHIQGTTYLPLSALDIAVNNQTDPVFADGVIARSLRLTPTATANLGGPVVAIPTGAGRQTMVYLTVYLCPGANTCTPVTGTKRLRAKVGVTDRTGVPAPGDREITVYSWSVVRQ